MEFESVDKLLYSFDWKHLVVAVAGRCYFKLELNLVCCLFDFTNWNQVFIEAATVSNRKLLVSAVFYVPCMPIM